VAEPLQGLDALVVDLQDAGARLFTNSALVVLALDAAAGAGIDVILLDRPNPLGGERVEGPEAKNSGVSATRLTGVAPGPLVLGLTLGDLLGTPDVRAALLCGDQVAAIVAADGAAIEAFKRERAKALLY
jgi:uncharacterized protein YbbC (DUF1343 family)